MSNETQDKAPFEKSAKVFGNTGIGNTGIGNTGIGNTGIGIAFEAERAKMEADQRQKMRGEMLGVAETTGDQSRPMSRNGCMGAARQSMQDSVIYQLKGAQESVYRMVRLERLHYLSVKHPEFMEMIELIQDLGLL